jgi:intraflagellar transport protein 56
MAKAFDPTTPQEYIIKAVSYASLGQETENAELLKQAEQYFQLVGASVSECDTIPGRQCMASCHFLLKQFDDALIYLKVQPPLLHKLEEGSRLIPRLIPCLC